VNMLRKRMEALEEASNPDSRIRYMLRWSSQDHDEAMRRWEESLVERGDPLKPSDRVMCIVWNDEGRSSADDWSVLRAPSYPAEPRFPE
jgi:hypothetical protein